MSDRFRWQALFQQTCEPLFVLDWRRRIIFANRAAESLCGATFSELHGLTCTRRASSGERAALGRVLAPPAAVVHGATARVHRPPPGTAAGPPWWRLEFLPLNCETGLHAILVRVHGVPADTTGGRTLSEVEAALRDRAAEPVRLDSLDERVPGMRVIASQARLAASMLGPIRIVGERGSGKRWLAQAIHFASARAARPFLALDATALPAAAISGALFGPLGLYHNDGAGTIYIDSPNRLTPDVQDELAQRIAASETGSPRVIAGTDFDGDGSLLEALAEALRVFVITVPPLRERSADWPGIIAVALERLAAANMSLSPEAIECIQGYAWPGNWDELLDTLSTALKSTATGRIEVADLPLPLRQVRSAADHQAPSAPAVPSLDRELEELERRMIVYALAKAKGNQTRAAELLQIWRPRLIRRIKALGIEPP